jgi:DNA polymerase III epsilon subunit-like protein
MNQDHSQFSMVSTPAPAHIVVPLLHSIAKAKNKTITVFDLETTTFVGQPTFGIAEIAAVHIHPDGTITEQMTLIQPEHPMSPTAAEITGISDDMLIGQPNWGDGALEDLHRWGRERIVTGFNCIPFDCEAVIDQNRRYGQPNTKFEHRVDVRSYWRLISGSAKGKLTEIAAKYGLNPEGAHRAIYDVRMTALLLEKFLEARGVAFFDHPGGAMNPNKPIDKLFVSAPKTADNPMGIASLEDRILKIIDESGYTDLSRLSFQTSTTVFDLTQILGDLMQEGRIDSDLLADRKAQTYLLKYVPKIVDAAWSGESRGRLKPLMDILWSLTDEHRSPKGVDYLQLRVFLKEHLYFAALDKSRTTGELVLPKIATPDDEPDRDTFDQTISM